MERKEAIEVIKKNWPDSSFTMLREALETLIPELKESEDERIRKDIIILVKDWWDRVAKDNISTKEQMLAWLEKQGEQSNWKPSKDEMDALYGLAYITNKMDDKKDEAVTKLYQDLKREFFSGVSYENMFPSSPVDALIKLEKQGEQKPADKIEPKFKIGDWAVSDLDKMTRYISEVHNDKYNNYYVIKGDVETECNIDEYDRLHHLWTIQDAKDGDVLHCWIDGYEFVLIYKGIKDGYITTYCHLYQNLKSFSEEPTTMFCRTIQGHFTPATKEQRDLLFQKMKEEGYEWDAEKKELKKISKQHLISNYFNAEYERGKADALKSVAWSEEDEEALEMAIIALEDMYDDDTPNTTYGGHYMPFDKAANRLKSLKDRVQPQPQQEWGEEDEYNIVFIVETLLGLDGDKEYSLKYKSMANWLKSLRPKKLCGYNPYKESIIAIKEMIGKYQTFDVTDLTYLRDLVNNIFAKCKDAIEYDNLHPKNTWKPSDEQMLAINTAINVLGKGTLNGKQLIELQEQLKKLREE